MPNDHVFIIAEMSANHCGDLNLAKKIIAAAKDAGADAAKMSRELACDFWAHKFNDAVYEPECG